MQTFLPSRDFTKSAKILDRARLGKQRVEGMQIFNIVSGKKVGGGWSSHPATLMWMDYPYALALYTNVMIDEWCRRGYKNTMEHLSIPIKDVKNCSMPPWLGLRKLHSSHRAKLLGKDPDHYGQFCWKEEPQAADAPYFWPARRVDNKIVMATRKNYKMYSTTDVS